jgi:hypothetical protein
MMASHLEDLNTPDLEYGKTSSASSEISRDDERAVETQLTKEDALKAHMA